MIPGEYILSSESLTGNVGRETKTIEIINTGDRPVQIGSHFHFAEVNPSISFDRSEGYGFRLDIPSGTAVRLEPGDARTVNLVAIGGDRIVAGFRDLVDGPLEDLKVNVWEGREDGWRRSSAAGDAPQELPQVEAAERGRKLDDATDVDTNVGTEEGFEEGRN
ncbi:urease subunit beta [Corynebacterium glutamicum]|uniref:urease subunit beta n=1 Tax=Corynebacterium glutamicum TaxID=1718 RepID=UPI000259BAB6|nr:urease subunit beta [Corynebacterium glutamicum]CCH23305.1 urea amidohydrolase (urease) beta subunit [Corynebacterium glutamicum K051]